MLPALWRDSSIGLPKLNINNTDGVPTGFQTNYSDAIDKNWQSVIPHVNLNVPTYRTEEGGVWEDLNFALPHVSLGTAVWNLILSCLVIYICVKLFKFLRNYRLSREKMIGTA